MLITKIQSFLQFVMRVTNEELSQASARVIFAILVTSYIFFDVENVPNTIDTAKTFMLYTLLYSILHWLHIYFYNKEYLVRKLIGITVDITATSIVLYLTGAEGALFFPIYFWIVVGNGVRFGTRYLFFAMILAFIEFQLVLLTSPFWLQLPDLGRGLHWAIVILPLFYFVIMHRLHKRNNILLQKLKTSTYEALHDQLTSLPNRAFLLAQMQDLSKKRRSYFLFFIDLDSFKEVNDRHGHDIGDEVLKEAASRIDLVLEHKVGFASRLGGDEFAVIAELKSETEAKKLATKLIKSISLPYKDCNARISASIGVTYFDTKNIRGVETLLKEADMAMYLAKEEGKHGFRCYSDLKSV